MRWFLLLMHGCEPEAPADTDTDTTIDTDASVVSCLDEPMELTPGTGDDGFVPLLGGDQATIVHGVDGLWYIPAVGALSHSSQNLSVLTVVTALDQDPPVVIAGAGSYDQWYVQLRDYDEAECNGTFWGERAYVDDMDGWPPIDAMCALAGQQLEIAMTASEIAAEESPEPPRSVTFTVIVEAALDSVDADACN
jgi:hypothetical protein